MNRIQEEAHAWKTTGKEEENLTQESSLFRADSLDYRPDSHVHVIPA